MLSVSVSSAGLFPLPHGFDVVPVFIRRTACDFLKLPVKIGKIIVAAVKRNIRYRFIRISQCFTCRIDTQLC